MSKAAFKIHFAALVGVAVDADLLRWWIPHYKALNLDTYTVFLHESPDVILNAAVEAKFILAGFSVTLLPEPSVRNNPICPGEPGIGVRAVILDLFSAALPKGDFLVVADGDELQAWPENPRAYAERGVGVVLGQLIDCFDESLHAPDPKKTLQENYPIEYFNLSELWRKRPFDTRKICMSPARYPVEFSGSHTVKRNYQDVAERVVSSGPIMVLHYRWRETALLRVKNRPNWPDEEISYIKNFFKVEG